MSITKNTKVAAVLAAVVLAFVALPASASANSYYYVPSYQPVTYGTTWYGQGSKSMTEKEMVSYLQKLILQLQAQLASQQGSYYYGNTGYYGTGYGYVIGQVRSGSSSSRDDDEPEVHTDRATSINAYDAKLEGSVDMMDFEDGDVFFVYGEDEDQVEYVENDYDSYRDIDEDGDDLRKVLVKSGFDGDDDFSKRVTGLNDDTDYYFQICVGFEDEDDDDVIICGGVEEFTTDRD